MKIFANTIAVIIIISVIAFKLLGGGLLIKEFSVDCTSIYNVKDNENLVVCTVIDPISLISDDYPLTISLVDHDSNVISVSNLAIGKNSIRLDKLEFSAPYTIIVSGFELIDNIYTSKDYYTHSFSTVKDNFISPVVTKTNLLITDTFVSFELVLTDTLDLIISISIVISDNGTVVKTTTLTDFTNLYIYFDILEELTEYKIDINVTYKINNFDSLTEVLHTFTEQTKKTPEIPQATISIISNNNANLILNVNKSDMDATLVTYTVVLLDEFDNTIHSESLTSTLVNIDISLITVDFKVVVLSNYSLVGTNFIDIEISTYNITTNKNSNFFLISTLNIVDITVPLDDYNDYDDYLYTNYNEGNSEFRIECVPSLDCTTLVNSEPYSEFPFQIIGMVHSFYDSKNISYIVTSKYLDITVHYVYTQAEIASITAEVNNIVNLVTTSEMTNNKKILAVHDYIVNNSIYDKQCELDHETCDNDHNAYGIFFDKNAVCEGYAHAMDIALRAMRIPSFRISSELHQWNAVYIDGAWMHLDVTWDDSVSIDGDNILLHTYYLISSTELAVLDLTEAHTYDHTYISFME